MSLTEEREPAPEVKLETQLSEDGYGHELVHRQGEKLDGDKLTFRGASDPDVLSGTELEASDSVGFYPQQRELTLVWAGDHGATYELATFTVDRTFPAPDEGCSWVTSEFDDETVKVDSIVVDCDVTNDRDIGVENGGAIVGDVTSENKNVDVITGGTVYGDVVANHGVKVQDGEVTGAVTERNENIKIDNSSVGGTVTADNKEIEVITGSSVDGDLVVNADDMIKVQSSSSVSGSVVTDGDVDLDDATIEGDVYVGGSFDCDNTTIDGQDCGSYTPRDPSDR